MKTKFTKGEWRINRNSATTVESSRRAICSTAGYSDGTEKAHSENDANAKLIAAAPDLLKAAAMAYAVIDKQCHQKLGFRLKENGVVVQKDKVLEQIENAIIKATL